MSLMVGEVDYEDKTTEDILADIQTAALEMKKQICFLLISSQASCIASYQCVNVCGNG